MEKNLKLWKITSVVLGIITSILLGAIIFKGNESKAAIRDEQLKTISVQNKLSKVTKTLEKQKTGTRSKDLVSKVNKLFNILSVYDTSKGEGFVAPRKRQASKITTPQALESIFPKDSDKGRPTVKTVNWLERDPEIYLMPSDNKIQTMLVIVDIGFSVADSEPMTSEFLYKLEFDSTEGVFTKFKNLGSITTHE